MDKVITNEELVSNLEFVKSFLNKIDFDSIDNVIFYSPESFFCYISNLPINHHKYNSLEEILMAIEPYTPCVLSEKNLDYFISASFTLSDDELKDLEKHFKSHMYIDFINFIQSIKDLSEWNKLLRACEKIRSYFENIVV